ncbi:GntR family transcriptional regulator/MocR family aminotransferase [Actinoplanes octamycinicus]|uniref:GntR family transcriptional regulator/MocR family aminotransferase n=1 Tax=Actinoplanes octamycinicus TaxID=135948 RepID=A0A7W7GWZ0_9ACTN|nr:PLP-dependent aminotransferase family protein [Actinoplanes octamycinicus]MBB4739854.1 GntR family transcriptional regulator/MocR family aminotransferase [Actinoplanes octamycinicus]GIE55036.1 GntR family transcriptional regulator [Actinoplanes octamycinicus]
MDLVIDGHTTAAVYKALRAAIAEGRLPAGHRLPASRALAADLGVSRGSVAGAYERLVAEGHLTARVGAGTFVAAARTPRQPPRSVPDPLRPRAGWSFEPLPTSGTEDPPRYDFRVGIPDASLFPFDTWRRMVGAELRLRANGPGTYPDPYGHPALRAAIARYLGYARAVRATADDVLVTNGAQHAFDLIGRVLLRPGDVVAMEDPGYPPARDLFTSLGARVVGVPVDADGLVVDALPAQARLVYVTPSHQFPLGAVLSLDRRQQLLDWARRRQSAIVEDDYDSEFRFGSRPLEPLRAMDRYGRVLYVGTFAKSMLPTIRTGFVLTPPGLRPALAAARQLGDGHGQVAMQAALARFIDEGQLARHVRRARREYAARHARIVATLSKFRQLTVLPSAAGLHVTALFSSDVPENSETENLLQYGGDRPGLVLGFGAVDPLLIDEGLADLAARL